MEDKDARFEKLIINSHYVCTLLCFSYKSISLYRGSGTMILPTKCKEHVKEQTTWIFKKIKERD